VWRALRIVKRDRPQVLWSTFPIATAHLIAQRVQHLTGLPWIADFRDSMTEDEYPTDPHQRASYRRIERATIEGASAIIFTTEGARRMYRERYPHIGPEKFHLIPNGYDEESFSAAELKRASPAPAGAPKTLLHSGILYPSERDPRPFLTALHNLKRAGRIDASQLRIVLRASGHDELIGGLIAQHDVGDLVSLAPSVAYGAALTEMLSVDALLLFQAANSNHQIPAKLYEYLRAGRPIFALTDHAGDTAATLRACGVETIADLASASDIEARLPAFLEMLRAGSAPIATRATAIRYSRESQAGSLAEVLNSCGRA